MIEELLGDEESSVEKTDKKFYGVTTGTVINPFDPFMQGRVQVRLPFIDSLDLTAWARVSMSMAGIFSGSYFVPNPGDEVLVAFEHGDVDAPIIIGSLSNLVYQPPLPTPVPQIRTIRTLAGNQIVFTELPPTLTLQNGPTPPEVLPTPPSPAGPYQTVALNSMGIQVMGTTITLVSGTSSIMISPAGIIISSGGALLTLGPQGLGMLGTAVNIAGVGTGVTVAGLPNVRIN